MLYVYKMIIVNKRVAINIKKLSIDIQNSQKTVKA